MSGSLAEALAIVEPKLPREFFDDARLAALEQWARNAPAVVWAGFESPLGKGERWVDFHQGFRRDHLPHLVAWLEKRARTASGDSGWIAPLLKFCAEWGRNDSLFFRTIPNLIFEYDVRDHPERISSPSLFIAFERDDADENPANDAITPAIRLSVIEAVLALFVEPARSAMLMDGIKRCVGATPANAYVTHLGLMLARNTPGVRINVGGLHFDQFAPYLDAIGWKGPGEELEEVLAEAYAFAERINLAVDVGERVEIPIGLECMVYFQNRIRWEKLLKQLLEGSVCTEEQYAALQRWWARESPSSATAPWPANLIVEGLLAKPDRFGVIDLYLNHIKITWQSGSPRKFKSYFGFNHHFVNEPKAIEPETIAKRSPRPVVRNEIADAANELERAISNGVDFLLSNRLQSGLWLDFPISGSDDPWAAFGSSDEWVTLYVAGALASQQNDDARRAAVWVWRVLNHRRKGKGWGHSWVSPSDADSTISALRLADAIGASGSAQAISGRNFLRRHQHQNGGIATYLPDAAISSFAFLHSSERNEWSEPHICVTAAAAHLREFSEDCFRFLRTTQASDGSWGSYWWIDNEYSTGLAAAALAQSNDETDQARVAAAVRWAIDRASGSGGVYSIACNAEAAFATALNLRALLSAPKNAEAREAATRSLRWLLRAQRPDGSWSPTAWLKTPPVNSGAPGAVAILALDRNANFTTATVLASLGLARGL